MKPIIIYGPERSGKTFLAKSISMGFEHPVFINGRDKRLIEGPWIFSQVTKTTDLIVFEDVSPVVFPMIDFIIRSDKIKVESRGKEAYDLPLPKIIIEGDLDKLHLLDNFKHRAKLIECWYGTYFSFQVKSNPDV